MRLHAVILAGGRGERFWPLSRRRRPKQFLPLVGERAMLTHTLERLEGGVEARDVWILTARDLEREARALAPRVPPEQVVGEPVGKNTAPAIALASWWLEPSGEETVVAVLPADHRVEPASRFREELLRAAQTALDRRSIVTLGIPPTRPETGYGYIETGAPIAPGSPFFTVQAFREKPDAETAARYLAGGRHLWNAGMFVFPPSVMLGELREHAPEIASLLARVPQKPGHGIEKHLERYYEAAPEISIDHAVMERTRKALVAKAGFAWDDLGSWIALGAAGPRDARGNVARGAVLLHDSKDVIAFAEGGLVAGLGIEDLVIVRTSDVTLVCSRSRAQEIRTLVERLKAQGGLDEYL